LRADERSAVAEQSNQVACRLADRAVAFDTEWHEDGSDIGTESVPVVQSLLLLSVVGSFAWLAPSPALSPAVCVCVCDHFATFDIPKHSTTQNYENAKQAPFMHKPQTMITRKLSCATQTWSRSAEVATVSNQFIILQSHTFL
jgi:hypothetical protein